MQIIKTVISIDFVKYHYHISVMISIHICTHIGWKSKPNVTMLFWVNPFSPRRKELFSFLFSFLYLPSYLYTCLIVCLHFTVYCRYENATKKEPTNEEFLSHLFMAYVRLGQFKKQQATALNLYKVNYLTRDHYTVIYLHKDWEGSRSLIDY